MRAELAEKKEILLDNVGLIIEIEKVPYYWSFNVWNVDEEEQTTKGLLYTGGLINQNKYSTMDEVVEYFIKRFSKHLGTE